MNIKNGNTGTNEKQNDGKEDDNAQTVCLKFGLN